MKNDQFAVYRVDRNSEGRDLWHLSYQEAVSRKLAIRIEYYRQMDIRPLLPGETAIALCGSPRFPKKPWIGLILSKFPATRNWKSTRTFWFTVKIIRCLLWIGYSLQSFAHPNAKSSMHTDKIDIYSFRRTLLSASIPLTKPIWSKDRLCFFVKA